MPNDQRAAVPNDQRECDTRKQFNCGIEYSIVEHRADIRVGMLTVDLLELPEHVRLSTKELHCDHAGEMLVEERVHPCEQHSNLSIRVSSFLSKDRSCQQ